MNKSVKVGLFVFFGLILGGLATFMIGDNRQMWDSKVTFHTAFEDVQGLKPGAPVRMGGVDVGTVMKVSHGEDVSDRKIHVTIAVVKSEATRVRKDTKAQILNKGLLGDKMVDLSTDGKGDIAQPGDTLPAEEPADFMAKLSTIAQKADEAVGNVEQGTRVLADPKVRQDLQTAVEDLRLILDGVARKDSAMHRLLMDPSEGEKLDRLLTNLEASTAQLNAVLADAHDVTAHVKSGPGLAHAVIYDGEVSQHAAGALAEVHKDLEQIRTGNGLAHAVLYGDTDTQHVMTNMNAMTDDLRDIVHGVKQGKGTLGALLVDPSVYEDIKGLVGNVERNEVLRALVRYSIKADEKDAPAPRVEAPAAAR
jgi:phospholipid/cholesterol/gamma-HCH transport system substrate-binding protein